MSAATLTPVIERALVAANRRRYARYASGLAHRIVDVRDAGTTVADSVAGYLADLGIRASVDNPAVRQVIDAINAHLNPAPQDNGTIVSNGPLATWSGPNDVACDVIRAFLLEDGKHLSREQVSGFEPTEIDALLMIAGLLEVPASDPVADLLDAATKDKDVAQRVAAFAVEHGFEV